MIIDRIMGLRLVPLLLTIALSNTALAVVVMLALYNRHDPAFIGPVYGHDWHGVPR